MRACTFTVLLLIPILALQFGGCAPADGESDQGGDDAGVDDAGVDDGGTDDGGTDDAGIDDGGTDDSGTPDGGSEGCEFAGTEYDAGWSGSPGPSCSASTIAPGDPLTCSVGVFGIEDITMVLVDTDDFNTAGSGFLELTADGLAEIEIDTQFAVSGVYSLFLDMAPDADNLTNYISVGPGLNGNYAYAEVVNNEFPDDVVHLNCSQVRVTVEAP